VAKWRLREQLGRSQAQRPDLIEKLNLNSEQVALLREYMALHSNENGDDSGS